MVDGAARREAAATEAVAAAAARAAAEASALRGELDAAHRRNAELERAGGDVAGILPLTRALEATQRERETAIAAAHSAARAERAVLAASLADADAEVARAEATAAGAARAAERAARERESTLKREAAETKRRARGLLMEREAEVAKLGEAVRRAESEQRSVGGSDVDGPLPPGRLGDRARSLEAEVTKARRDGAEWRMRCIELTHALHAGEGDGGRGGGGG